MAAVEVTISGVLFDKTARTMQPVVLIGEASLTGLGIGGGPILPPSQPPTKPPDWGAHPEHPIFWPPHPAHPIVLPPDPPPTEPPTEPPTNPPNVAWSWCWNPRTGWIPAYVAGDKPQPPGAKK